MHDCPQAASCAASATAGSTWVGTLHRPPVRRHPSSCSPRTPGRARQGGQRHRRAGLGNIQNVSTDGEQGTYSSLYITVQVTHRLHLAKVIRGLRTIPEVVRIGRMLGRPEMNRRGQRPRR